MTAIQVLIEASRKAETAAQKSLLQHFAEGSPELDIEGEMPYISDLVKENVGEGEPYNTVLGYCWLERIHRRIRQQQIELWSEYERTGDMSTFLTWGETSDSRRMVFHLTNQVMFGND